MSQPLYRFLGSGDALERLQAHAQRLARLQQALARLLPDGMAGACDVANLKSDKLVLLTRTGAGAARLKQMAPTLLQQLQLQGFPVGEIQVRVRVAYDPPRREAPPARSIPAAAQDALAQLAASLPADAPLRESLQRLIERSRSR